MRFSHLKLPVQIICTILVTGLVIIIPACNNDAKEGNTSTTETVTDTTTVTDNNTIIPSTKTDTVDNRTAKKMGKVTIKPVPVDKSTAMTADKSGYYNYTETMPSYPGGQSALESYITSNLEYPEQAIDKNTEGTVYVMFTVDENGKVANAKTTGTALGDGLEEAAIKVVNAMSNWSPGTVKGKKAKAWYTLPITFRLE